MRFDESTLVAKIVNGLPKRYFGFMSQWSAIDADDQTMAKLSPRLLAEKQLHEHFKKASTSSALVGDARNFKGRKSKAKSPNKSNDKKPSNPNNQKSNAKWQSNKPKNNKGNSQNKGRESSQRTENCFFCKEPGHWIDDCSERKDKHHQREAIIADSELNLSLACYSRHA